jgi:hypothetical protein
LRITRGANQQLIQLQDIFGNGREQMHQQSDTEKDAIYRQMAN